MSNTVVGIFEYTSEAQEAQKYLLANGFSSENVDIKTSSTTSSHVSGDVDTGGVHAGEVHKEEDTMDRIGNFFKDLFGDDDDEVNRYTEAGRKGTILTVHARTADEAEAAARILDNYGAVDVNETAGSYMSSKDSTVGLEDKAYVAGTGSPYAAGADSSYVADSDNSYVAGTDSSFVAGTDAAYGTGSDLIEDDAIESDTEYKTPVSDYDSSYTTPVSDTQSIPVIEEELQVGKREVQTGGVRLKSRIIERPVQESVRLREEYVTVERTPVDRVATDADFDTFKEGTIEVIEHAEVPVVTKEARVVQEVSLRKEVDEREETISDTVRSTQVDVEDLTDEESLRKSGLDV